MIKKRVLIIIFLVLWFALFSFSHGLKLEIEKRSPCVLVTSMYYGGSAIAGAGVKVFFYERQREFQKGWTDKNGKFSFIPDKEGTWYFQVDDGMGHKKKVEINVDADFFKDKAARESLVEDHTPLDTRGSKKSNLSKPSDDHGHSDVNDPSPGNPAKTQDGCIYCKVLLGVVLIFVFTFILYAWKRKGEGKRQV